MGIWCSSWNIQCSRLLTLSSLPRFAGFCLDDWESKSFKKAKWKKHENYLKNVYGGTGGGVCGWRIGRVTFAIFTSGCSCTVLPHIFFTPHWDRLIGFLKSRWSVSYLHNQQQRVNGCEINIKLRTMLWVCVCQHTLFSAYGQHKAAHMFHPISETISNFFFPFMTKSF